MFPPPNLQCQLFWRFFRTICSIICPGRFHQSHVSQQVSSTYISFFPQSLSYPPPFDISLRLAAVTYSSSQLLTRVMPLAYFIHPSHLPDRVLLDTYWCPQPHFPVAFRLIFGNLSFICQPHFNISFLGLTLSNVSASGSHLFAWLFEKIEHGEHFLPHMVIGLIH